MNKIFYYSLGVLAWLNTQICVATEKFEILPDLPDPLAYAVQPAEASTISSVSDNGSLAVQSVGQEPSIISVVLSLAFVVLLIYLTGIIYTKLNRAGFRALKKQQGELAKSQVSVVSTTQLGNNKTLHVVELDGKRMLIGASSGAIQLIKDLGSINEGEFSEEYSHIEIPNIKIPKIEIPKIEIPSIGFSKLITKSHKSMEDIENASTEENISDKTSESIIEKDSVTQEETPEVIIDSLFAQEKSEPEEVIVDNTSAEHIVDPDEYVLYKKYLG